jgi:ABC-type dipeptide/oligopeptide/nickel transport system ATPase component
VKHGYARPMLVVDGESGSGKSQYASFALHRLLSDGGRNKVLTIVCSNEKDADLIPIENELRMLKRDNESSYKVDRSRLACEGVLRCVTKALHCDRIGLCIQPPASWTRPTLHIVIDEIALLPHFVRAIAASLKDVYGLPEFAAFESVYLVCAGTTGGMSAGDHVAFRITDPHTYTLAQFTFRESQVLGAAMRNEYIRLAEQEGNVSLTRALHHPLAVQVSSNARMLAYLHSHCRNQSDKLGLVSVEAALVSATLEYRSTNGLAARSPAELRAIALLKRRSPILSRQVSRSKQRATGERCAAREHSALCSTGSSYTQAQ